MFEGFCKEFQQLLQEKFTCKVLQIPIGGKTLCLYNSGNLEKVARKKRARKKKIEVPK